MDFQFPDRDELMRRYAITCDLKQVINTVTIEDKLREWASGISEQSVVVRQANSQEEFKQAARDALDAWATGFARDALDAWAAGDARDARYAGDAEDMWAARAGKVASDARDAWAARAGRDAGAARFATYYADILFGAIELNNQELFQQWYPLFEALEAGLWVFCITKTEIVYITVPIIES